MIGSDDILTLLVLIFLILLGLCMGSFASAISYRIINGLSWISQKDQVTGKVKPVRSICPKCSHQLYWNDLIPLISWISSKGKCRYCYSNISIRYPLIEIASSIIVLIYFLMGLTNIEILVCVFLLPFSISFILLKIDRFNPPNYVYLAVILNITYILYSLT